MQIRDTCSVGTSCTPITTASITKAADAWVVVKRLLRPWAANRPATRLEDPADCYESRSLGSWSRMAAKEGHDDCHSEIHT